MCRFRSPVSENSICIGLTHILCQWVCFFCVPRLPPLRMVKIWFFRYICSHACRVDSGVSVCGVTLGLDWRWLVGGVLVSNYLHEKLHQAPITDIQPHQCHYTPFTQMGIYIQGQQKCIYTDLARTSMYTRPNKRWGWCICVWWRADYYRTPTYLWCEVMSWVRGLITYMRLVYLCKGKSRLLSIVLCTTDEACISYIWGWCICVRQTTIDCRTAAGSSASYRGAHLH